MNGSTGLAVYDAGAPASAPWPVVEDYATYASWSPDGTWISYEITTDWRRGLSSLFAVPATGGAPVTLVEPGRIGHHVWAANGRIYYWEKESDVRHRLEPPRGWEDEKRGTREPVVHLVVVSSADGRRSRPHVFKTVPRELEWVLPGFESRNYLARDVFPDGKRFLLTVFDSVRGSHTLVVDAVGEKLVDLEGPVDATSVSSRGDYIAGVDEIDDGHVILSSKLYLRDAFGRWGVPIEGAVDGIDPHLSKHGLLLAFRGIFDGRLHVGRLEITSNASP